MTKEKISSENAQRSLFPDTEHDDNMNKSTRTSHEVPNSAASPDEQLLDAIPTMTIDALAAEIRKHNDLYARGQAIIRDLTFDHLVERMRHLAPEHPVISEMNSPQVRSSGKVVHDVPMLSIHKPDIHRVFQEIANWLQDFPGDIVATPKIDGLACSIAYDENGDLRVASTRGNGRIGENITDNVRYIASIPAHIDIPNLEVRGEVYMPLDAFNAFDGDKISARNLAVGGLKQKKPRETAAYHLSFFAYEAVKFPFETDVQKFETLQKLGFITPEFRVIRRNDSENGTMIAQIQAFCEEMTEQRRNWNFDADGLVFKVNDNRQQEKMGNTQHHPRCAIAFKFPCMEQETTLRKVIWQVGKGATITPVAVFDTVELAGAMVQKATLSNAAMIENFPFEKWDGDIKKWPKTHLKIGAKLLASRRGDVIPHIEYVVSNPEDAQDVELPTTCPACGAPALRDGLFLRCSQPDDCPAIGQALIENYAKVVKCVGLGPKIIESLYDAGYLDSPADLYRLDGERIGLAISADEAGNVDQDAVLPQKIYRAIQETRKLPFETFLEALSIPKLGHANSRDLASQFGRIDNLLDEVDKIVENLTQTLDEKQRLHSEKYHIYSGIQARRSLIDDLRQYVEVIDNSKPAIDENIFNGKQIVFTGELQAMKRDDAEALIENFGAKMMKSVSRKTHILIATAPSSSKYRKALECNQKGANIEIWDEERFMQEIKKLQ